MHNWKKEIFTIPNLLSLFRLLLIPVYTTLFLRAEGTRDYWIAAGVLALSTLTDMVDGKIARKFNMVTRLGIVLDPIADKATQFTLLICLACRHPVLWYLLGLFLVKESFMLVMGLVNLHRRKMLGGALMSGKICTTVLFVSMIILVLFPDISQGVVNLLVALCVVVMLISLADYMVAYFGKQKKVQDI
ncbi:MAG: CDP-alcohol phosphatidyltransferase family protein [Clostridiales bacterium]|nr:CDP-alcohol phosphatidyltransferase family protein [Clostridiales bacterium]